MEPRTDAATAGTAAIVVLVAIAAVGVTIWIGAALAAGVGGQRLHAGLTDAIHAAPALAGNPARPAAAWPPQARAALPGPLLYWTTTGLAALAVAAVGGVGWVLRPGRGRFGFESRRRLGTRPEAVLARRRHLTPLVVPRPLPGRFLLGRHYGRFLVS